MYDAEAKDALCEIVQTATKTEVAEYGGMPPEIMDDNTPNVCSSMVHGKLHKPPRPLSQESLFCFLSSRF